MSDIFHDFQSTTPCQEHHLTPTSFHNHIVHHILTIFALGATPSEIHKAFEENNAWQRPHFPVEDKIVQDMSDKANFREYLGKEKYLDLNQGSIVTLNANLCVMQIFPRLRGLFRVGNGQERLAGRRERIYLLPR